MGVYLGIDAVKTGRNIKYLMQEKAVTPQDIKDNLGFTTANTIYRWFNGNSLPNLDNLVILSQILKVPIDDIIIVINDTKKK